VGTLAEFDPYDNAPTDVAYDVMAELRSECPVARLETGFWYFSRYEEVAAALKDGGARVKVFSHEGKNRATGVVVPDEQKLIMEMEGPRHLMLRRLLQTALHPRLIASSEPYIEKLCNELIDAFADNRSGDGEVDLVTAYGIPVPCHVLAHVLGLPEEDHEQFRIWSDEVNVGTYPALNRNERGDGLDGAHPEFSAYIDAISEDRRRHPRDDLFTRLVETEVDGERLTTTERRVLIAALIIAANETTANLISNALYRLVADPDQYRAVRDDPELIPNTVEESLRLDSPTLWQGRRAVTECTVAGTTIEAGERVILGLASANRTEEVFDDADDFRVDRANADRHVAFGGGAHFCPGAPLARLEGRVAVSTFLRRIPEASLVPGYVREKWQINWANGPRSLPVRLGR
jgi:cytochrome P450